MRRKGIYAVALVLMLALGGCGQKQAEKDTKVETTEVETTEAETTEVETTEAETTEAEEDSTQNVVSDGEANFSVDSEMVTEFAQKVQLLVASEDLEGLADVTAYPVYIGFAEDGQVIESKEELIALGADKIFTPELKNMIAGVDVKNLSASMAGFVMSDDSGKPNITFSMTDGALKIVGINY